MTDLDDPKEQRKALALAWALFFIIVSLIVAGIRCAFVPGEAP